MAELLFVYGTLDPARAPEEIAATARRLALVDAATIRGLVLDLGEYPGALLEGEGTIAGKVFALPEGPGEPENTWKRLDAYEDFRLEDEAASLFVRRRTVARLEDGTQVPCWVYVWNGGQGRR